MGFLLKLLEWTEKMLEAARVARLARMEKAAEIAEKARLAREASETAAHSRELARIKAAEQAGVNVHQSEADVIRQKREADEAAHARQVETLRLERQAANETFQRNEAAAAAAHQRFLERITAEKEAGVRSGTPDMPYVAPKSGPLEALADKLLDPKTPSDSIALEGYSVSELRHLKTLVSEQHARNIGSLSGDELGRAKSYEASVQRYIDDKIARILPKSGSLEALADKLLDPSTPSDSIALEGYSVPELRRLKTLVSEQHARNIGSLSGDDLRRAEYYEVSAQRHIDDEIAHKGDIEAKRQKSWGTWAKGVGRQILEKVAIWTPVGLVLAPIALVEQTFSGILQAGPGAHWQAVASDSYIVHSNEGQWDATIHTLGDVWNDVTGGSKANKSSPRNETYVPPRPNESRLLPSPTPEQSHGPVPTKHASAPIKPTPIDYSNPTVTAPTGTNFAEMNAVQYDMLSRANGGALSQDLKSIATQLTGDNNTHLDAGTHYKAVLRDKSAPRSIMTISDDNGNKGVVVTITDGPNKNKYGLIPFKDYQPYYDHSKGANASDKPVHYAANDVAPFNGSPSQRNSRDYGSLRFASSINFAAAEATRPGAVTTNVNLNIADARPTGAG